MNEEVILADKKLRRQILAILVLCVLVSMVAYWFLSLYVEGLKSLVDTDPEVAVKEFRNLVGIIVVVNLIFSLGFGYYFGSQGIRIWRSGRYPLPGARVIKDTKVRVGSQARVATIPHFVMVVVVLSTNLFLWRIYYVLKTVVTK